MKRIVVVCGLVVLLAPGLVHANTGIGLLSMWIPVAIVAFVPAVLIEGPILARLLKVTLPRGFMLSAVANAVSTIAGGLIALAGDFALHSFIGSAPMSRGPGLVSLAPMFFVTWWLEHLVVKGMMPAEGKALSRRATFAANVVTYVLMAIAAWFLIPAHGESLNP